jgi:hypothetical protein
MHRMVSPVAKSDLFKPHGQLFPTVAIQLYLCSRSSYAAQIYPFRSINWPAHIALSLRFKLLRRASAARSCTLALAADKLVLAICIFVLTTYILALLLYASAC